MDYKEVKLVDNKFINVMTIYADKIQTEFDSFIILIALIGYDEKSETLEYHNDNEFIEYDFNRNGFPRIRLLFHINDKKVLHQIDFYYHNTTYSSVTFKSIVQGLSFNGDAKNKEIENLFKVMSNMI